MKLRRDLRTSRFTTLPEKGAEFRHTPEKEPAECPDRHSPEEEAVEEAECPDSPEEEEEAEASSSEG